MLELIRIKTIKRVLLWLNNWSTCQTTLTLTNIFNRIKLCHKIQFVTKMDYTNRMYVNWSRLRQKHVYAKLFINGKNCKRFIIYLDFFLDISN